MIHIEHFTFNSFQTRCSVVWDDSGVCAFVDPGCASAVELSRLTAFTASRGLRPAAIMLTHAHFDHIYGVDALVREYGIPVYMHPDEVFTLRNTNPYVCRMYGLPEPETTFADGLGSGSDSETVCEPADETVCEPADETASETACGHADEKVGGSASGLACGSVDETVCEPADETASETTCGHADEKVGGPVSGLACGSDSETVCEPADETASETTCGHDDEKVGGLVTVTEGDVIEVGTLRFEVIETPGHTAGGICLFEREDGVLFTGDTLFAGAIGRTDHPGGDYDQLMKSILQKLLPLDTPAAAPSTPAATASVPAGSASVAAAPADNAAPAASATSPAGPAPAGPRNITVVPGHGPCTDLAREGMTNPFLMPFNEPYED